MPLAGFVMVVVLSAACLVLGPAMIAWPERFEEQGFWALDHFGLGVDQLTRIKVAGGIFVAVGVVSMLLALLFKALG